MTRAVTTEDLTLTGSKKRTVYGPASLSIEAGGLHVLRCLPGSGSTTLGLTLAGRMKATSGSIDVFGASSPRRIAALASIAAFDDVDSVDPALYVADVITERLRWASSGFRRIRRVSDEDIVDLCTPLYGDHPIPTGDTMISDLGEVDDFLLRVTLALVEPCHLLVIDDIDKVRVATERTFVLNRLAAIATPPERYGDACPHEPPDRLPGLRWPLTIVVTSVNRPPEGAGPLTVHTDLVEHLVTDPETGVTVDVRSDEPQPALSPAAPSAASPSAAPGSSSALSPALSTDTTTTVERHQ